MRPGPVGAPYGAWTSPLTARAVAAGGLQLSRVILDGEDIYWLERRPEEGGRSVVVKRSRDGRMADVTPAGTNVRTRVHEYGGGGGGAAAGTLHHYRLTGARPPPR